MSKGKDNKPKAKPEAAPVVDEQEEQQLTPEEYAKARSDAKEHLEKEIEYLEVEAKYTKLQADIEENKTRRITMIAQQARYFNPPKPEDGEVPEGQPEGQLEPAATPQPEKPSKPKRQLQKS